MADPLYLSLWFPSFDADEMLPHALAVMRQFPFSSQQPGITYLAVQPVSWTEATVLEQRFRPGATPEEAVLLASNSLHEDNAYSFEAFWDLWAAGDGEKWVLQPAPVKFIVHGLEFDEAAHEQEGQMLIELGLDTAFLQEQTRLTDEGELRLKDNVQKLVDFSNRLEQRGGASARLLWSESDDNFAQKLIARLQRVN